MSYDKTISCCNYESTGVNLWISEVMCRLTSIIWNWQKNIQASTIIENLHKQIYVSKNKRMKAWF